MAYIDVLPLAEMKTYLRVDDSQADSEITSMINSAFLFLEGFTNILVVQQAAKEYLIKNGCVRVYDYPINSVVKGIDDDDDDVTLTYKSNYYRQLKPLYTLYYDIDVEAERLVLDVGYATATDVPDDIVLLAKEIVSDMYYAQETDKTIEEMLSPRTMLHLNQVKRFII